MYDVDMRTTINLDDHAHEFATFYSRARGLSLSAAISELIRKAEVAPPSSEPELEYSEIGLPLLPRSGKVITCELVKKLEEEEFDPAKFARS